MITPRQTRLVRVADLRTYRHVIVASSRHADVVVVPTSAAARVLGRVFAEHWGSAGPRLLTRSELYDDLHARLVRPPRRLSSVERDALFQAAARDAAAREPELSFQLRPGLVAEILRFYDQLRRQSQQTKRFEELISAALGGADDRGAGRLLVQTRFLASTFREYELRLAASGACDEHTLRTRLVEEPMAQPLRRIVVTVGDWIAEPEGLFVADFDMLARIPKLETIDIVCTEAILASGMHERMHSWWPGLEEIEGAAVAGSLTSVKPVLVTPAPTGESWFTFRDREEELAAAGHLFLSRTPERTAVVFKHPLPYLYLAPDTLGAAGIPYEVFDALPLAAEPTAAAVDAVLDLVETGFTRASLVALLGSPHFHFASEGIALTREHVAVLDRTLSGERYLGDLARLEAIRDGSGDASPGLDSAVAVARELAPLAEAASASAQLHRLIAFMSGHFRALSEQDPLAARDARARDAIVSVLTALADAHRAFHDPDWTIADLAAAVRRWISEHTFVQQGEELAGAGVYLLDDQAARYGDFDTITIVGLIENEWPERARRNIFYGSGLLKALGWPSEKDRRGAADARFLDLIASAKSRVLLSSFTLDDESLVTRSMQLDDIPRARLSSVPLEGSSAPDAEPKPPEREWADVRVNRPSSDSAFFHGRIGAHAPRAWSVSALETYIGCPFKFFAQHVLRLQEEPEDEEVMDPRRQGQFVHEVFENFFHEWQKSGRRAIVPANLDAARSLFASVVETALRKLPEAEAGLERTRLLGSPAAAGLGEAVFRMEAERPVAVVERLLEERLDGEFRIETASGGRTVRLRGKADRIDLLEDGTFRLIDYKLGWPPNKARALQLPIYALCAERRLAGRAGRQWTLGEAAYVAFKGPRRVIPLFSDADDRDETLRKAQQRLADTIDAIERGDFPPTPDDVFRCETCSFAAVCRKDYV